MAFSSRRSCSVVAGAEPAPITGEEEEEDEETGSEVPTWGRLVLAGGEAAGKDANMWSM